MTQQHQAKSRTPKQRLFFGNPKLRRMGETYSLDKEQMKIYLRCSDDPNYFIDNFVQIVTQDEGRVGRSRCGSIKRNSSRYVTRTIESF